MTLRKAAVNHTLCGTLCRQIQLKKANISIHNLKQAGCLSLNLSERNETTLYISDMIIAFHSAVPYCVFITLAASLGAPVPSLVSAPSGSSLSCDQSS